MSSTNGPRYVARLRKTGYSLVFSIPPALVRALALKYGDFVVITCAGQEIRAEKIDLGELARLKLGRKYAVTGEITEKRSANG